MPRRSARGKGADKMTLRQQAQSIWRVAKLSFKVAPGAVLFKLSGAIIEAVLPLATAFFAALTTTALVEAYNGSEAAQQSVFLYVVITAALGLISMAWRSVDRYIQESMRYRIESKVSDIMYEQFLGLDFWRYDDKETADLYDKAQKFAQFFAWIFDRLATIASQLITMVVGVGALFVVNVWLAAFILVAIIPGVYLQFKLSRAQIAHWNKNIDTRRTRNMIEWNLLQPDTITELRMYGMVRHLLKLRAKMRDKDEKARIDFEKQYIFKQLGADGLQAIAEVGALLWVTVEIINRAQPVGQFVYVQQIVSRALGSASGFISQLSTIDEDVANLFDYEKFMQLDVRDEGQRSVRQTPEEISFEGVSFSYPGQKKAVLQDISLTIKKHQHIALVGENGAGKTTFIKLLAGLYRPSKGSVKIDGVDLTEIDSTSWHKQLGVLKQDFTRYIFATARDNVLFGNVEKHDKKQLKQALDAAEASEFTRKLPKGLDGYVNNWMEDDAGNKGIDLSGGQWQRLALARSFYRDAPIIVLDEPTSAIDALAEARIFRRLFKETDKTIITISHRLTTVEKADVIYMLEEGRLVEQGTHKELVQKKGRYYRMFRDQLHESEQ